MVRVQLIEPRAESAPLAWLVILALAACAGALVSGMVTALTYTEYEPFVRALGLTLQHLRPIHESFALAWLFLGGVAVVYLYLFMTFGSPSRAMRRRMAWQVMLWAVAGIGILVTLLGGEFTGREYLGYHPGFSLLILAGWLLFAWNFFASIRRSDGERPVYIYMWSVAVPLFLIAYAEGHLYLLDLVRLPPVRDIAIQWKANGVFVGTFNLLVYGSLMYVVGRMRDDDRYAHSRTAFALFCVALLNTFTNYGHHTFHLPQSPWIHWISFVVSMLEIIILAKVLLDVVALQRHAPARGTASVPERFVRASTVWTFFMLFLALLISVPPLNALIHGTHVIVAHSMGSMIGIDSMILWAALSYVLCHLVGGAHPAVSCARARVAIPFVSLFLLGFLSSYLAHGVARGWARYAGPSAPDFSALTSAFPSVMLVSGFGLAATVLWILGQWTIALIPVAVTGTFAGRPAGAGGRGE